MSIDSQMTVRDGETIIGALDVLRPAPGVLVLSWASATGAINQLAGAIRAITREAIDREQISRVSFVVPASDTFAVQVAMRTGMRREGIARMSIVVDEQLVDAAVFATIAGDPATENYGGFTHMLDSVMAKKRLISHAVMTDHAGRILLCRTGFKSDWELPGGIVEPGEPPAAAARREIIEEIGVDVQVGRLLVVDWLPPYLGWGDALELLYDGGEYDADFVDTLSPDGREILEAQWCTLAQAQDRVSELNARRLGLVIPVKPVDTLHLESGSVT